MKTQDAPQTSPRNKGRSRHMSVIIIFLIGIAISHTVFWLVGAQKVRESVLAWIAEQQAAGLIAEHDTVKVKGYPLAWRMELSAVTLGQNAPDNPSTSLWRWRTNKLQVIVAPYRPTSLVLVPIGEQNFEGEGFGAWRAEWREIKVHLASDREIGWRASLEGQNAQITDLANGQSVTINAAALSVKPQNEAPDTITAAINLDEAALFKDDKEKIRAKILKAALTLTQTPALLTGAPSVWRAAEGKLLLDHMIIDAEGAYGQFDGALALDEAGYPTGQVNAALQNPGNFARALGALGVITPETAKTAEAGLSLAAITQGGKIAAPIVMKNGAASILGVKLSKLPQVN